ncbi:phosphatidylinositol 4-kinase A [Fistulifera solaris]|uniref:1-phosphatidylinositol 4-kinase n=1 Tax=Fistulifera solaris TaxID=1519565 RepID=A0A1Z5J9S4_FISSO|nr:phosphatidylinositol 4-kinase A [Fistulifera solaris]|eukprot:GAX10642.1 phosphatidylinositol 4-kinase A [Fistulifera solaris]
MNIYDEHEVFKNRLVEEVLGSESSDKVPMEKVVMLLWQFRDDPSVITFMARFISKFAGSRHVFDGIEFYLPQLAHMIIHLEVDWDDAVLERLTLVIAQQSLHFALQLNWILQGALEDYQPELPPDFEGEGPAAIGGVPNPNYDPVVYNRCLNLLRNVERCVVYGKPRAATLQRLYEQGKITQKELIILEQADRRFNALQITEDEPDTGDYSSEPKLDGWTSVQMPTPLPIKGKQPEKLDTLWVQRYCTLDRHVLNCYKAAGDCCQGKLTLDRAMSLERAVISHDTTGSLQDQSMTLLVVTRSYQFRLRFPKPEEAKLWLRRMKEEADTSSLFHNALTRSGRANAASDEKLKGDEMEGSVNDFPKRIDEATLKGDLTQAQLERYEFFQNERLFVQALTGLAEELRECDRSDRKILAPQKVTALQIPPAVYLPLCNSTHTWRRVASPLPKHTRVFNTKERCPVIMHFLTKRGELHRNTGVRRSNTIRTEPNCDVAEYMHSYFDVTHDTEESIIESEKEANGEDEQQHKSVDEKPEMSYRTQESGSNPKLSIWDEEDQDAPTPGISFKAKKGDFASQAPQSTKKGNRLVQLLLRDNVVTLPPKLAKRMKDQDQRRKSVSVMDLQTHLQDTVPILDEAARISEADCVSVGEKSIAVERSSILIRDKIVLADLENYDIDAEAMQRAKQFVCSGVSFAEKSAQMLESTKKEMGTEDDEMIQLEIASCMSKSNDDLRQEVFVMQMIHYYKSVFAKAGLPLWLKTYRILSVSSRTGLLEVLVDATSLDGLKKAEGYPKEGGLRKYFEMVYGDPKSKSFITAQTNFMQSLAGYAIVSYLLGLKDRHNGNIMIDTKGRLIHIDFGFALGMAPGHEFSFERAPFKFTKEYVEVLGGVGSDCYKEFERLFVAGIEVARKNSQIALGLVEIMMYKSNYPCFSGSRYGDGKALTNFQKRLMIDVPDSQVKARALKLIRRSRQHFGTYLYDVFQHATNGYAM